MTNHGVFHPSGPCYVNLGLRSFIQSLSDLLFMHGGYLVCAHPQRLLLAGGQPHCSFTQIIHAIRVQQQVENLHRVAQRQWLRSICNHYSCPSWLPDIPLHSHELCAGDQFWLLHHNGQHSRESHQPSLHRPAPDHQPHQPVWSRASSVWPIYTQLGLSLGLACPALCPVQAIVRGSPLDRDIQDCLPDCTSISQETFRHSHLLIQSAMPQTLVQLDINCSWTLSSWPRLRELADWKPAYKTSISGPSCPSLHGPNLRVDPNNCVVKPIKIYAACTREVYRGWKCFFIVHKPSCMDEIKAAMISSWIAKTVRLEYNNLPEDSSHLFTAIASRTSKP